MNLLGIDIGGTKTSICVGNERGTILASQRMPTAPEAGAEDWLVRMSALSLELLRERELTPQSISAVGIAAPGPLDVKKGLILSPPNMPGWDAVPLIERVRLALGLPVYLNNDANAGALAEYHFGAERGVSNLVYLTHSTGMGGGVIANGRLVQGITDMAGEVGHFVIDSSGPQCPCGLRGCFEVYCGGLSVARRLRDEIRAGNIATAIVARAGGNIDAIDFKAFVAAARENDPFAARAWREYVERLAQGVGAIIMLLNPEAIVLGTIAIQTGDFLLAPLRKRLQAYAWQSAVTACRVTASALGAQIGDYGALSVALEGLTQPGLGRG